MWAARAFLASLAVLAIAWADRLSHAKQYQPETETAFIRPEMPVQKLRQSVPCLMPPERPKRVVWVVRDADGNIIIAGSRIIRERC